MGKLEKIQDEYSVPPEEIMTVSQLNKYISGKFKADDRLSSVYLLGEVSNLSQSTNGHLFFDIKDEESKVSCVLFNSRRRNLEFEPEKGKEILIQGEVEYYEKGGKVSIKPSKVYPVGEGIYYKKLRELRKKLRREGLFEEKHKKSIPRLPAKIGIVTSKQGDALRDMVDSIHGRFPDVDIYVKHSPVQGENAAEKICHGIEFFDDKFNVDIVLVGRGGGSIEDLQAFNEEEVARTIFKASTPIITGVGHKEDETVAGYVADYKGMTPTEAGKQAVQDKRELEIQLRKLKNNLSETFTKFRKIKEKEKEVKKGKRVKTKYRLAVVVLIAVILLLLWWLL